MAKSDDTLDTEKLAAAGRDDDDGADRSSSSPPSSRDDDEDDDEDSEPSAPAKKAASEAPPSSKAAAAPALAHAVAGHADDHDDHGLAHVTPLSLLVGVLSILIVLTIVTVVSAGIDLGAQWNLVLAMVIATIKASLVVTYFMHLRWDKKLHLLIFLSSVLFLILFLAMSLTDRKEYQQSIDDVDRAAQQQK